MGLNFPPIQVTLTAPHNTAPANAAFFIQGALFCWKISTSDVEGREETGVLSAFVGSGGLICRRSLSSHLLDSISFPALHLQITFFFFSSSKQTGDAKARERYYGERMTTRARRRERERGKEKRVDVKEDWKRGGDRSDEVVRWRDVCACARRMLCK